MVSPIQERFVRYLGKWLRDIRQEEVQVWVLYKEKNKLLFKWQWQLGDSNSGGWQDIIKHKHKPSYVNGLPVFSATLSQPWKGIYSIINFDLATSTILNNECYFKVGNGKTIKFQTDKWLQVGTFQSCFLRLYKVLKSKTATLVEMGDFREDSQHQDFRWNQRLRSSDQTQLQQLVVLLDRANLSAHKEDLRHQGAECTRQQTIKSCSL